ncbi:MAG: sulfite exporter TauE/SafE family protein, partial [Thermodesulfobacteriota bacterium]|nr:sulfite exporter TauE/SafE family protein [Thermodesulfobacteriota bacterium]
MNFFKQWGKFMMQGSQAFAQWEINNARTICSDKKRLFILGLLIIPVILGGIAFASDIGGAMPDIIGGHHAY